MKEERLKEMIGKLAPEGVSGNLRERAVNAARDTAVVRRRRTTFRWSLAATVLSGIAVVGIGALTPKANAASVIDRVAAKADAQTAVHLVQYDMVKGGRKISELWWDRGSYRHDDGVETVVWRNGRFLRRAWGQGFVTASDGRERPSLKELGNFRASASLRPGPKSRTQFIDTKGRTWEENGRPMAEFFSQQEGHHDRRMVLWVDTERDLFTEVKDQRLVKGRWEDSIVAKFDFAAAVPESTFRPKAFEGKPVVDLATQHATWEKRLQTTVTTVQLPGEEVRIHDVFRNQKGGVFVLFTRHGASVGERNPDARVWMEDDRGVAYTRALFDPSWTWNGEWQPRPLMVGGQKMEGLWMIPTASTSARSYQLSFDLKEGTTRKRLGTVRLAAPPASAAQMPEYAPILSLYPFDANIAKEMEAYAMQRWWDQRWVDAKLRPVPGVDDGEWYGAWGMYPPNSSATPGARVSSQSKEEGLEWTYRQLKAQEETERMRSERFHNGYVWYRAYGLALDLGHGKEAAENLRRARERNPEQDFPERSAR